MRSRWYGTIGLVLASLCIFGILYMTSSPWKVTGYFEMTVTEMYPEEGREPIVYFSADEDAKTIYTALSSPSYSLECRDCIADYRIEFSNGALFYLPDSCGWVWRKNNSTMVAFLPEETTELLKQMLSQLT